VIISLPLLIIFYLFSSHILSIFGEAFSAGSICLIVLATGQFINALGGSNNSVLLLTGHSRIVLWNSFIVGIFQIGLGLLLIPRLGMSGAAISAAAGLVLVNCIRTAECFFILRLQPYEHTIWKPFVAGLGASICVSMLGGFIQEVHLSWSLIMLFVTYALFLIVLGLDKDDREIVLKFKEHLKAQMTLRLMQA
jgi:O-antigen/teichoic acid export membrane protein